MPPASDISLTIVRMTRAYLREDALLGAGAIFAIVMLESWRGGGKAGQ